MSSRRAALAVSILAAVPFLASAGTMDSVATSLIDAGLAAHTKGDDKAAEKKLLAAVKTCGVSGCAKQIKVDALMDLGAVQAALGKSAESSDSFRAALKLDPTANVAKALRTPEVTAALDGLRTPPPGASSAPSASAPPSSQAAPPPAPLPMVIEKTRKVGDADWVDGLGLVRPAAVDSSTVPSTKSLLSPPIEAAASRTAASVRVAWSGYTPHPNGSALCPVTHVPTIGFGVDFDSFRPGDAWSLGVHGGMGAIGLGSIAADPTNPCAGGANGNGTSFSTPLRWSVGMSFDVHPPFGLLNALAVGVFAGFRGQLWLMSSEPGSAGASTSTTSIDLGADYGLHARYTLGSLLRFSAYLDGAYRLRWSGTRRGDYAAAELGFATRSLVFGVSYETLLKAVGGDLTSSSLADTYARNVPLDSELGVFFGFRL